MIELKIELNMTLSLHEVNSLQQCMIKIKEILPDFYPEYEFADKMLESISSRNK